MRLFQLLPLVAMAGCSSFGGGGGSSAPAPGTTSTTSTPPAAATSAPTSFVRSTAESQVTRTIDVREGLTRVQAMRVLTDALNQKYTVDVSDARAGFVMTAWQASVLRDGVPDLRYRTRITARFVGADWRKLTIQDEANWARGEEWDVGFDLTELESVAADLRAKLGKKA